MVLHPIKTTFVILAVIGVGMSPPALHPPSVSRSNSAGGGATSSPEPVATSAEPVNASTEGAPCPASMVHVEGDYCPEVEQVCKHYLDPPPYQTLRCAEYETPVKCLKPREHVSFCIDREEHTEVGSELPTIDISFVEAKAACANEGKALCNEDQWQFACEGEEMRPYPYGFARDSTACNFDQTNLGSPNRGLRDLRAPNSAYPRCLSPFGVHNMTGNVDEWVEGTGVRKSTLHGGWWLPGRNRCRATTYEHGPEYFGKQVGFRCCKAL